MKFSEWFDIYNTEHMESLKCFINTGKWPSNFLPPNCSFNANKEVGALISELALLLIDHHEEIMPIFNMKRVLSEVRKRKS